MYKIILKSCVEVVDMVLVLTTIYAKTSDNVTIVVCNCLSHYTRMLFKSESAD